MALVSYTGKNVFGVCMKDNNIVRFLPGINEIEDSIIQTLKTYPTFMSRLEKGLINIMTDTLGKDGKRTVEDMLKNIPQIYDTKLLKKIIDLDGRERVVKCAEEQYEKIKNPAKAKADESDEHFK